MTILWSYDMMVKTAEKKHKCEDSLIRNLHIELHLTLVSVAKIH